MPNIYDESRFIKLSVITLVFLVLVFGIWSLYAPLNSVVVATGTIIVQGKNKKIQHLEGGIVSDIFVDDGDYVKKGDVLVELDKTQNIATLNMSKLKKLELEAKKIRLEAQRDKKPTLEIDIQKFGKNLVASQKAIFDTQVKYQYSQINILKQKLDKSDKQKDGLQKLIELKTKHLRSIEDEIDEQKILFQEQLVDKLQLRDSKRRKIELQSEISQQITDKASLEVDMLEIKEQILSKENEYMNEILSDLRETSASLLDINEKIVALEDKVARSKIVSPIDGIVQNKQVYTKGAVIKPGFTIMEIVANDQTLMIEGKVDIMSIDKVIKGQLCDIRFSAFDTKTTLVVEGMVEYISADKLVDKDGKSSYYEVDILPTKSGLEQIKKNRFDLKAGMPVEVMIKTGARTLSSYLIRPFIEIGVRAFNED